MPTYSILVTGGGHKNQLSPKTRGNP